MTCLGLLIHPKTKRTTPQTNVRPRGSKNWVRKTLTRTRHLLRRIRNIVAPIIDIARIAVEGMQEAIPMADLMGRGTAEIVALHVAARHGATKDIAAVDDVAARQRRGGDATGGQGAEAQQRAARRYAGRVGTGLQQRLVVDVERRVGAAAQSRFHTHVVAVGGPGVVVHARDAGEPVADRGVGVGAREVQELVLDHGVCNVVGTCG